MVGHGRRSLPTTLVRGQGRRRLEQDACPEGIPEAMEPNIAERGGAAKDFRPHLGSGPRLHQVTLVHLHGHLDDRFAGVGKRGDLSHLDHGAAEAVLGVGGQNVFHRQGGSGLLGLEDPTDILVRDR